MSTTLTIENEVREFANNLIGGKYDEHLDYLTNRLAYRRKALSSEKLYSLQIGDRVRFVNCNPKYLNGSVGTVRKINRTKIVVDLDHQNGRFFRGISTPTSMIEKV